MARRERPDNRKDPTGSIGAPKHAPSPSARSIGRILLVLLLVLATTGVVLAWAYVPDPTRAHDATAAITQGPLWWVRSLHAWAASATLALALILAARVYVSGEGRSAGRMRAFAGLAALAILFLAFFTGTVLPWDQHAWESFDHLVAGSALAGMNLAEDDQPLAAQLASLFYIHAIAVPVGLTLLLFVRPRLEPGDALPRVGRGGVGSAVAGAVVVLAVAAAAVSWPPSLGPKPIAGLSVSRPAWPFLWLVPIQDVFGTAALLALPAAFALAAVGIALRHPSNAHRRAVTLGLVAGAFGLLTALGAM